VHRQGNLLQVVPARHAAGRLARGLHCGQEERDEDANDRDDDEQLDEREGGAALHVAGGWGLGMRG
jgi:hypothetical protein